MATVIKAPEEFDVSTKPSIFLAGSIDQGKAPNWSLEVTNCLRDVDCVVLNPRRTDWDSSWEQDINNAKFKEQVEWELKGLEEASFIALCFTKESQAPISLLELGLHVTSGKMVVCCPKGYWRKGNVDVVCSRYGVRVVEDFGEFCREVKERMLVGKSVKTGTVKNFKASDRKAWRKDAKAFIIGIRSMDMSSSRSRQAVSVDFNEMMRKRYAPHIPSFKASLVNEGDVCTVNFYVARPMMNKKDFGTGNMFNILKRILLQGDGKVVVEKVQDDWAMVYAHGNPVSRMIGSVQVPVNALKVIGKVAASNHKDFDSKKEALEFLEDHALMSVGWKEGSKQKVAIYWNGKLNISDADKKQWWVKKASEADQVADPMAKEKMSSMFLTLHTWATRKATSLPPGAPVVTQILDGLNAVEEALKGKMGLTGKVAVGALLRAAEDNFTLDAPPFPALMRKYGRASLRDAAGYMEASKTAGMGDTYPVGALRGRPDYGERDGDIENKIVNIENNMPIENVTMGSDNFRVQVIVNRMVKSAKQFMA